MVGVKDSVKNNATTNARMKEATEIASMGSESELRELAHKLSERIKELNCLYGISKLVEQGNSSVDEILQDVVDFVCELLKLRFCNCFAVFNKRLNKRLIETREVLFFENVVDKL